MEKEKFYFYGIKITRDTAIGARYQIIMLLIGVIATSNGQDWKTVALADEAVGGWRNRYAPNFQLTL